MSARLRVFLALVILLAVGTPAAWAYENGRLPDSAVNPINTGFSCEGARGQLVPRAAAGYNTMALAEGRALPTNGCASAYRPIGSPSDGCSSGTQWGFWRCYGAGRAAYPGTSNHGWATAVDVPPGTRSVIDSSGGIFGFQKSCSDAAHEPWHVNFCRSFSRPDPGLNRVSPTLERGSGGPGQAKYVRQVQHLLRRAGAKHLNVDGDFGKRTARALKAYQRARGLKPDGVVGPNVWKRLRGPVRRRPRAGFAALKVSGPVDGVDVSQHQGSVNWERVADDGIEFAIVKSSEGEDYRDPTFSRARLEAIRAAGIVPGVYHYLRPRPGRPGSREAVWFLNVIQAAGLGPGDLRPAVDIEETALSPAATCAYLRSFMRTVRKQLGVKPIVYTGQYSQVGTQLLNGCPDLGDWLRTKPLWIAAPGNPDPYLGPWSGFAIRQTSFTGRVDGISGDVDLDVIPGGRDQLSALRMDSVDGHGGNPDDGTRDPVDGRHRNRPPCSSKDRPHRCHLRRRCERGHELACKRLRQVTRDERDRQRPFAPRPVVE